MHNICTYYILPNLKLRHLNNFVINHKVKSQNENKIDILNIKFK